MHLTLKLKTMKYKFTDKFSMMTRRQKRIFKFQCFVIAYVIITSGIGTIAILDYTQARYSYYRNVYELGTAFAKGGVTTPSPIVVEVPVIKSTEAVEAIKSSASTAAQAGAEKAVQSVLSGQGK